MATSGARSVPGPHSVDTVSITDGDTVWPGCCDQGLATQERGNEQTRSLSRFISSREQRSELYVVRAGNNSLPLEEILKLQKYNNHYYCK